MNDIQVLIRAAESRDAAAIAEIYNEAIRTTTATFDTEPKSVADRQQWLDGHDGRHPVLVAELEHEVVGWAALSRWSDRPAYDETVETSCYVRAAHRGRGIGRRLKEYILAEARRLGFHTVIARVAEGSHESLHLNASLGFEHIGTLRQVGCKFGRRLDVHILQLLLERPPPTAPPSEPPAAQQPAAAIVDRSAASRCRLVESLTDDQRTHLQALYDAQWWSQGRSRQDVDAILANTSLTLGLIEEESGRLVGFCRVLTDYQVRAMVYDVMVDAAWRKRGLGRRLMDALLQHPRLQQVAGWQLNCRPEMVSFYAQWGFAVPGPDIRTMTRRRGPS